MRASRFSSGAIAAGRRAIQRWRTVTGPTTVDGEASEGVSHRVRRTAPGGAGVATATDLRDSPPVRIRRWRLVAVVAAPSPSAACDDDGRRRRAVLRRRRRATSRRYGPIRRPTDDVDDLIDLWRDVGDDAPLAIEAEWDAHADNLELAWTSDDQQEVVASTFAAERSAVAIADWLADNCGIDLGPGHDDRARHDPRASLPGASTTTTSTTPAG